MYHILFLDINSTIFSLLNKYSFFGKSIRLVKRTYRLICLKSTTPEELYARKVSNIYDIIPI